MIHRISGGGLAGEELGAERFELPPCRTACRGARTLAHFAAAFPENALLAVPAYDVASNRVRESIRDRPSTNFFVWVGVTSHRNSGRNQARSKA